MINDERINRKAYKNDYHLNLHLLTIQCSLIYSILLQKGKYVKVGSRSIHSWIKLLPDQTDDGQILYFQNELYNSYQLHS